MKPFNPQLKFKGRLVAVNDYSALNRIFPVALGQTDASWSKEQAEAVALDAAIDALAAIRQRIAYVETRGERLRRGMSKRRAR